MPDQIPTSIPPAVPSHYDFGRRAERLLSVQVSTRQEARVILCDFTGPERRVVVDTGFRPLGARTQFTFMHIIPDGHEALFATEAGDWPGGYCINYVIPLGVDSPFGTQELPPTGPNGAVAPSRKVLSTFTKDNVLTSTTASFGKHVKYLGDMMHPGELISYHVVLRVYGKNRASVEFLDFDIDGVTHWEI